MRAAAQDAKKLQIKLNEDLKIKFRNSLNTERLEKWQKNEGNSHTRRTRWDNRAIRLGANRGDGNLLRDVFYEVLGKNGDFFIDGKYNENHG